MINKIGFVQIDSIKTVERAHIIFYFPVLSLMKNVVVTSRRRKDAFEIGRMMLQSYQWFFSLTTHVSRAEEK